MSVHVTIYGEGEAARLGTHLIRAGDGELKERLYEAIRRANLGLESEVRRSALTHLPKRNGLAAEVGRARIAVRRLFGAANGVGISITASHKYDLAGLDQGGNVHPLFGNRRHWYFQHVRSGWFSDVVDGQYAPTASAIERAVKQYAQQLER